MAATHILGDFTPTFRIKITGEDIARSCAVVFLHNGEYHWQDLEDFCEESASGKILGSYRIRRQPLGVNGGDFFIVHIEDIRDARGDKTSDFSSWDNNWDEHIYNSEEALREKLYAREITEQQHETQLKSLRAKIKDDFIKKCSLTPLALKLDR